MSDLAVKNFAVFKDNTSFNLKPLTFLIGANGSGKSSLVKVLNLIEYDLHFGEANKFDLSNIKAQLQDAEKPLEISYKIAVDLVKKLRLKIYKENFGAGEEELIDFFENSLIFTDENDEVILSTNEATPNNSSRSIKVELDVLKFYTALEKNGFTELKNKLIISSIPEKKVSYELKYKAYGGDFFEQWFYSEGMFEVLSNIALDDFIPSFSEINELFLLLFQPSYFLKKLNFSAPFPSKSHTSLNLEIIRLNDIGEAKTVFTPEDPFGETLKELEAINSMRYIMEYDSSMNFFQRWIDDFFGQNSTFEFDRELKEFYYFSPKLNGKYLTEHGTGIFRILHLIAKLSTFYYDGERIPYLPKDVSINNSPPFIRRRYIVLEEPEANLHPDYQVKLAQMLYELSKNSNCYILVETHSEYMIRMLQYLVAKEEVYKDRVGIINFGTDKDAGKVKHLSIQPNGSLSDNFYSGFFNYSEDLRLMLDALNNKRNN
jgi:predicted ATPase